MILQLDKHDSLIWLIDEFDLISDSNDCSDVNIKVHDKQRKANQVAGEDSNSDIMNDLNASVINDAGIFDLVILISVSV